MRSSCQPCQPPSTQYKELCGEATFYQGSVLPRPPFTYLPSDTPFPSFPGWRPSQKVVKSQDLETGAHSLTPQWSLGFKPDPGRTLRDPPGRSASRRRATKISGATFAGGRRPLGPRAAGAFTDPSTILSLPPAVTTVRRKSRRVKTSRRTPALSPRCGHWAQEGCPGVPVWRRRATKIVRAPLLGRAKTLRGGRSALSTSFPLAWLVALADDSFIPHARLTAEGSRPLVIACCLLSGPWFVILPSLVIALLTIFSFHARSPMARPEPASFL